MRNDRFMLSRTGRIKGRDYMEKSVKKVESKTKIKVAVSLS